MCPSYRFLHHTLSFSPSSFPLQRQGHFRKHHSLVFVSCERFFFPPPAFILFILYFRPCSKVSLWEDKYSQGYQWRPVRSVRERGYKGKHSFSLAHSWITEPIDFLYLSTALVSESLQRHWRLCLFSYRCSLSAYTGVHIHIFCCSSTFMHLFSQVAEPLQERRGFFIRYYSLLRKGRNW